MTEMPEFVLDEKALWPVHLSSYSLSSYGSSKLFPTHSITSALTFRFARFLTPFASALRSNNPKSLTPFNRETFQ
jgi:hypothetical protein